MSTQAAVLIRGFLPAHALHKAGRPIRFSSIAIRQLSAGSTASSSRRTVRSRAAAVWTIPTITKIAKQVGRTPAQVLLRWSIQHGNVVLPKSTHEKRIQENGALFDFSLDEAAMKKLDALDEGAAVAWDPRSQA
jgi:diketogulonate reductase-like aldo/keto reductase